MGQFIKDETANYVFFLDKFFSDLSSFPAIWTHSEIKRVHRSSLHSYLPTVSMDSFGVIRDGNLAFQELCAWTLINKPLYWDLKGVLSEHTIKTNPIWHLPAHIAIIGMGTYCRAWGKNLVIVINWGYLLSSWDACLPYGPKTRHNKGPRQQPHTVPFHYYYYYQHPLESRKWKFWRRYSRTRLERPHV